MKKIIDVSYHNGNIDWVKVKQSDEIFGAIIRCGYGDDLTSQDDKKFTANVEGCLKNNIPFGVYIYSYATTTKQAESEARHALRLCEKYKNKMAFPIYYDIEEKGTEKGATERARIFANILTAKGYKVGIYASLYWWNNYLKGLNEYSKWVARYSNIKPPINNMDIWQYTSCGKVSGIMGKVDFNYLYKEFEATKPETATEKPKTTTEKKSNSEIAAEVLAGKWGNGVYRKNKLTEAGYNYNEIQKIVNEIISPKLEIYTVKKGDSLWKIAQQKLGNPNRWVEIKTLNGLQTDLIYVGQRLKLPK